jgi:phosphoglycerol transferase
LSLANLVLPIIGHRISAFANLASRYYSTAPAPTGEADFDNLGIIATLGTLWLIVMLAVRSIGGEFEKAIDPRYIYAALGAGAAFLIGTVGGLATLFAYVVNPQLRAPNRIAIFIAFFALFGVALALDKSLRWLTKRSNASWIPLIPLATVLLVGVLDQTSPSMAPPYQAEIAEYRSAAAFVSQIERTLPRDSAIFQLPYVPFPENPPVQRMQDYAELTGYIFSTNLHWSYGAIKGRPADWEATVVTRPMPLMLAEVSSAGFRGIYVDTFGYADGGAALIGTLRTQLRTIPTVSPDGRLYFFDIRSYYQRLRARHSPEEIAHLRTNALHPNEVSVCRKTPSTTPATRQLKALCVSGATPQLTS